MLTMEIDHDELAPGRQPRKQLTEHERIAALSVLLGASLGRPLPQGILAILANHLGVGRDAIGRLWREAKLSRAAGFPVWHEVLSKKGERGRKKLYDRDEIKAATMAIPRKKRRNIRAWPISLEF